MISRTERWWGLSGILLVGLHLFLFRISPRFAWGGDPVGRPILLFVAVESLSGFIYLLAVRAPPTALPSRRLMLWIVGIGLALRLPMLFSTPILEDDYYRYLWDGGLTAHGENPYARTPSEIIRAARGGTDDVPPSVRDLAHASAPVIDRINHPDLRTIYPPVAQGAFALGHAIAPWRLGGWRAALLFFDGATLLLLLAILRGIGAPAAGIAVYWWNPLLVKEIFNSGHMDVVVLPFVLGALLLAAQGRQSAATLALAAATGVKLWPAALLPLLLLPLRRAPARRILLLLLFAGSMALLAIPVVTTGLDPESGFTAYGARWEMNDALFMLLQRGADLAGTAIPALADHTQILARLAALLLFAAWTTRVTRRPGPLDLRDLTARSLAIVAAAFLLSPTQFPWYFLWMLPLLALHPRTSLLLLTALLPIYNLRFWFRARSDVAIFDDGIVWLEYIPVWILLAFEWRRRQRRGPAPSPPLAGDG